LKIGLTIDGKVLTGSDRRDVGERDVEKSDGFKNFDRGRNKTRVLEVGLDNFDLELGVVRRGGVTGEDESERSDD